jgi:hypothetical protein
MYYKARYYDPMLGRFLSADSVISPNASFGMNRFMYVEGNPLKFTDTSGNAPDKHLIGAVVGALVYNSLGGNAIEGAVVGHSYMNDNFRRRTADNTRTWRRHDSNVARNFLRDVSYFFRNMRRDGARYGADTVSDFNEQIYKFLNGGRNRESNDFDHALGGSLVEDFWNSDLGRSDIWQSQKSYYSGESQRYPWLAFRKTDVGRSDLGRAILRNQACVTLAGYFAMLVYSVFTFNPSSAGAAAAGIQVGLGAKTAQDLYTIYQIYDIIKSTGNTVVSSTSCQAKSL